MMVTVKTLNIIIILTSPTPYLWWVWATVRRNCPRSCEKTNFAENGLWWIELWMITALGGNSEQTRSQRVGVYPIPGVTCSPAVSSTTEFVFHFKKRIRFSNRENYQWQFHSLRNCTTKLSTASGRLKKVSNLRGDVIKGQKKNGFAGHVCFCQHFWEDRQLCSGILRRWKFFTEKELDYLSNKLEIVCRVESGSIVTTGHNHCVRKSHGIRTKIRCVQEQLLHNSCRIYPPKTG